MAQEPFIGSIFMFAGNFAPKGYQFCQGQLLPISQYSALFSILGTTYGGNGTTNFGLPDLRGRAPVGQGSGPGLQPVTLGELGGSQSVTLQASQMPQHTHATTVTIHAANDSRAGSESPADAFLDTAGANLYTGTSDGTTMNAGMATAVVAPAGGSQPVSVLDPFLGVSFIIAIDGIFPSRN